MAMLRVWVWSMLALVLVVAGAAAAALLAWPTAGIAASTSGLASVSLPGFSGHVENVSVLTEDGKPVPVTVHGGIVWPHVRLAAGQDVRVTVDVRRPSWIGWLVGRHAQKTVSLTTPVPHIRATLLRPSPGSVVTVRFAEPVSRVRVSRGRRPKLGAGRSVVPIGVVASGAASTGTTTVAAAARRWETLSTPVRVAWFASGAGPRIISDPAAGGRLRPHAAVTLTFAKPVAAVLGSRLPRLQPATPGHWQQIDSHTLSFEPRGFGFGLGGTVHVRVPGRTLAWTVAPGSTLRLQEILGRLGYLPLRWRPAADPPPTLSAEVTAAVSPPDGTFSWRFGQIPASLRTLWKPGAWNVVTQGAVMRFEDVHGMTTDGVAGPEVGRTLFRVDRINRRYAKGYSYVLVHETIPQSLSLWHNGRVILTSPGNTGIAQAPTAPGTWPVFEHIPVGTMSG